VALGSRQSPQGVVSRAHAKRGEVDPVVPVAQPRGAVPIGPDEGALDQVVAAAFKHDPIAAVARDDIDQAGAADGVVIPQSDEDAYLVGQGGGAVDVGAHEVVAEDRVAIAPKDKAGAAVSGEDVADADA